MKARINPNASSRPTVPVVTAFITSAGMVALFKRSARVGTYKGAWAGVSGYIERLPLEQAYLELLEETGLLREDVELRGIGVPMPVPDHALGHTWLVHPFLFEVRQPDRVRIDWESEILQWMTPGSFGGMLLVPGLERALSRVWPQFGDSEFWEGLSAVAVDTVRGATSLALSGLEVLQAYLERDESAPVERAATAFAASRPSMGLFPHLAAKFLQERSPISEIAALLAEATSASAGYAAEALSSCRRVLTNSYSSAVEKTLLIRAKRSPKLEVIVAESRPGMEGVRLARRLAEEDISVSVITDAQAGIFVPQVDAVVVGCDAIAPDNTLRNKVGTSLLLAAAQAFDVQRIAVAQTFKIVPRGFPSVMEEQDPDRVGREEGIRFRNLIFDETPVSAFSAIYTENGALTPDQLRKIRTYLGAVELA